MRIEPEPITGREDKDTLSPMLQALSEFYEALNNRDLVKMEHNWLQSDEAVMDNPLGGIKRGWEEIKAVYQRIFAGTSRYHFEFFDYSLHLSGELFFVVGRERGEFITGDTRLAMAIRTTRIFRLADGRWQQVHHHGSMEDPDLLLRYQNAVQANS